MTTRRKSRNAVFVGLLTLFKKAAVSEGDLKTLVDEVHLKTDAEVGYIVTKNNSYLIAKKISDNEFQGFYVQGGDNTNAKRGDGFLMYTVPVQFLNNIIKGIMYELRTGKPSNVNGLDTASLLDVVGPDDEEFMSFITALKQSFEQKSTHKLESKILDWVADMMTGIIKEFFGNNEFLTKLTSAMPDIRSGDSSIRQLEDVLKSIIFQAIYFREQKGGFLKLAGPLNQMIGDYFNGRLVDVLKKGYFSFILNNRHALQNVAEKLFPKDLAEKFDIAKEGGNNEGFIKKYKNQFENAVKLNEIDPPPKFTLEEVDWENINLIQGDPDYVRVLEHLTKKSKDQLVNDMDISNLRPEKIQQMLGPRIKEIMNSDKFQNATFRNMVQQINDDFGAGIDISKLDNITNDIVNQLYYKIQTMSQVEVEDEAFGGDFKIVTGDENSKKLFETVLEKSGIIEDPIAETYFDKDNALKLIISFGNDKSHTRLTEWSDKEIYTFNQFLQRIS